MTLYFGLTALILNLAVSVVLTLVFNALGLSRGTDETCPAEYTADPATARAGPHR